MSILEMNIIDFLFSQVIIFFLALYSNPVLNILLLYILPTVDEAVELLRQYNIYFSGGTDCHFLIADASGNSVLVEYYDGELQVVTTGENYQIASNFIAYNELNIGEGRLQWSVVYNLSSLIGVIFANRNTGNLIEFGLKP